MLSPTECKDGTYGFHCQYSCSRNCLYTNTCHKTTGNCPYGCRDGWKMSKCEASKNVKVMNQMKRGCLM